MGNPEQIMFFICDGVRDWSELSMLKDIVCCDTERRYYFKVRDEAVLIMSRGHSYRGKTRYDYILFELAYFCDFAKNDWLYKDWLYISSDFDNWNCGLSEEAFKSGIIHDGKIIYRLYLGEMALNG